MHPADESSAEILRAIGHFLDEENATRAKVVDNGFQLVVSWISHGTEWHRRMYPRQTALDGFRVKAGQARAVRAQMEGVPDYGWEELLRTLGQELDRERLHFVEIWQSGGIRVTATADGVTVDHTYSEDELRRLSESHRTSRSDYSEASSWWRRLLLGARR